jgi:putative ABC transport system permease protein
MREFSSYREALSVAATSLNASKLRSFLTLLGVILATTTLIVVMSMVHGMDVYIAEQVSDMGTDGFQVQRIPLLGEFDPKKYIELEKKNPKLNMDEYRFLLSHLTLVRELGVEADENVSVHCRGEVLDSVNLMGVTPNIAIVSNIQVAQGRFITNFEDQRRMSVAFIGNDVRERFFRDRDPVGKTIVVSGRPFEVLGTANKRGSVFGSSRDNFVIIPIGTFLKTFGARPD